MWRWLHLHSYLHVFSVNLLFFCLLFQSPCHTLGSVTLLQIHPFFLLHCLCHYNILSMLHLIDYFIQILLMSQCFRVGETMRISFLSLHYLTCLVIMCEELRLLLRANQYPKHSQSNRILQMQKTAEDWEPSPQLSVNQTASLTPSHNSIGNLLCIIE